MLQKRYIPVKENRLFTFEITYDKINWHDFNAAIDAFVGRMEEWYFKPIETLVGASVHFGFPVVGLTCLLIDTLAQYYSGKLESSRSTFNDFVRENLPSFAGTLSQSITVPQTSGSNKTVADFADALYSGFRCGILHEAHVALYGVIVTQETTVKYSPIGYTKYLDGTDCPSIVIDSRRLFDEVKTFYQTYIRDLKDTTARFDSLRENFRKKFAWSFGIDIGNE